MSAINLYDFETAIETAVAAALTDAGLIAVTPSSDPTFQKTIPRIEVSFQPGAAKQTWHPTQNRNCTWTGMLSLAVVTEGDSQNRAVHRQYKAELRNVMADLRNTLNATLDYHKIQNIVDAGVSSESYQPEQGVDVSVLHFNVDFGIDNGAWVELNT